MIPCSKYPDVRPKFHLRNPRGLDDQSINAIQLAVEKKLDESIGQPVVFDLIDLIREHLTDSNLPTGQCVVCLYGFQEGDEFTKTLCYHYLHSYCLVRHLLASKKNYQEEQEKLPAWQRKQLSQFQPVCPVCREPIDYDVEPLRKSKPPTELKNAPKFELTAELKGLQARMSNLFLHQKRRGGIIDLDAAEANVISIDTEESSGEHSVSFIKLHLFGLEIKMSRLKSGKREVEETGPAVVAVTDPPFVPNQSGRATTSAPRSTNNARGADAAQSEPNVHHNHHHGGGGGGGRRSGGGGRYNKRSGYHHHHRHRDAAPSSTVTQIPHPSGSNPR